MIRAIVVNDLKNLLEKNHCSEHGTRPYITIVDNTMTIICCCDHFLAESIDLAKELIEVLGLKELQIQ